LPYIALTDIVITVIAKYELGL